MPVVKKLTDICFPKQWNTVSLSELSNDGYPCYGANGIIGKYKEYNHESATVMIGCRGSCGNVLISEPKSYINGNAMCLENIDSHVLPKYLYYYLKSYNFSKIITGTSQPQITRNGLSKLDVLIYDLETQKEIISFLDCLEDLINKTNRCIKLYDNLVKSQFIEMFGDFNFSQKNNDWVKIKNLGLVVGGSTPKTTNESYWNGQYCWITPDELNDDSYIVSDTARHITLEGVRSCSLKPLPVGTVLLSSRAPIGKVAVAGIEMYCNQGFKNIICGDKLNPTYLYCLLKFNVKFLQSLGRGSTFLEVSKSIVENVSIPCPPIELQKDFAFFFEQIDKSKFRLKELQSKLENLYKSLLQKYFG